MTSILSLLFPSAFDNRPQRVPVRMPPRLQEDYEIENAKKRRVAFLRGLALLCACSLSIGAHFGLNTLGPLKSQLSRERGTSNAQFSLLIAAFTLNSTWTPLVGGLLVARLGTTASSIIATSVIFAGQLILLLGDLTGSIRTMALGMFIFGLGISPIAVVQETIVVRYFKDHGLGLSLALGLVAGKLSSFVSARISFPLSQWNEHGPFFVSTSLAGFSFVVNLFYLWYSKWVAGELGLESDVPGHSAIRRGEDAVHEVTKKKVVRLGDLWHMGDTFWLYIFINIFCGFIWVPFPHLAPNIIERRYGLSEGRAAEESSLMLAGPIFLYPLIGYVTDIVKDRSFVHRLLLLSSVLTLFCYSWLALPSTTTNTPLPGLISFGIGIGFSPLLLVIIVPHLVPVQYVSTALGAHKSIESSGSTTMQTLSGLALDSKARTSAGSIQKVLNAFLTLNIIQFIGVYAMMLFDDARRRKIASQVPEAIEDEEYEVLTNEHQAEDDTSRISRNMSPRKEDEAGILLVSPAERARGRVFFIMSGMTIFATWVLFITCTFTEFYEVKK